MSKINATFDIENKEWNIETVEPNPMHSDLNIIFTSSVEVVKFNNLAFGASVTSNEQPVLSQFFPTYGVTYDSSASGSVFEKLGWSCTPETEYIISLWAEIAGEKTEISYTVTSPRTEQPFPSWTWDSTTKIWNPPIPRPENAVKEWNEEIGDWQDVVATIPDTVPTPFPVTPQ